MTACELYGDTSLLLLHQGFIGKDKVALLARLSLLGMVILYKSNKPRTPYLELNFLPDPGRPSLRSVANPSLEAQDLKLDPHKPNKFMLRGIIVGVPFLLTLWQDDGNHEEGRICYGEFKMDCLEPEKIFGCAAELSSQREIPIDISLMGNVEVKLGKALISSSGHFNWRVGSPLHIHRPGHECVNVGDKLAPKLARNLQLIVLVVTLDNIKWYSILEGEHGEITTSRAQQENKGEPSLKSHQHVSKLASKCISYS